MTLYCNDRAKFLINLQTEKTFNWALFVKRARVCVCVVAVIKKRCLCNFRFQAQKKRSDLSEKIARIIKNRVRRTSRN